jgi:hypothetical protein
MMGAAGVPLDDLANMLDDVQQRTSSNRVYTGSACSPSAGQREARGSPSAAAD